MVIGLKSAAVKNKEHAQLIKVSREKLQKRTTHASCEFINCLDGCQPTFHFLYKHHLMIFASENQWSALTSSLALDLVLIWFKSESKSSRLMLVIIGVAQCHKENCCNDNRK